MARQGRNTSRDGANGQKGAPAGTAAAAPAPSGKAFPVERPQKGEEVPLPPLSESEAKALASDVIAPKSAPKPSGKSTPAAAPPARPKVPPPTPEARPAPPAQPRPQVAPLPETLTPAAPLPAAKDEAAAGQALLTPAPPVPPAPPEVAPPAPGPPSPAVTPQPPLLFEVAWEVCWQLGGIYTVLKTKAATMLERWGDRYCLVGPYNPQTAPVEFEEQPTYGSLRDTLQKLKDELGLTCYFGRWLIPGRPRVVLIDYRSRYGSLDNDKYLLWQDHGISTLNNDGEVNEVVAFGFAVAEFFRVFTETVTDRPVLAHFHEWMGGVAVPRIAHLRIGVATIFTTHATLLGRYLASDNPYFYDHLGFIDPDKEAAKYNIYPRFAIERAAARASTVFTTVSEVTAREAEKLLGRRPECILPNGLNIHRFAAPHEFQHLHAVYKQRIHEFVTAHFFPSYTFDLDRTVYLFTSGRYEYRNKGMDLFLEALWRLNHRMREEMVDPPTVVAFIVTKAMVRNVNVDVLRNQAMFDDLKHTSNEVAQQMGQRLLSSAVTGRLPTYGELMPDDAQVRLKRALHAWKTHRQPLIVTHDLVDDANDPVLKHLRHRGMFNLPGDPVKVVFHPEFVTATSPTISLDYDQFVRGCHIGVFPSYYEPWGYTPMECVALGLPSVTTDLSGFGAYVEHHVPDHNDSGIVVLPRRAAGFEQSTEMLVNYLMGFLRLTRRQRIELRNRVERLGELFDWSNLVRHYDEAHNLALERVGARRMGTVEIKLV